MHGVDTPFSVNLVQYGAANIVLNKLINIALGIS